MASGTAITGTVTKLEKPRQLMELADVWIKINDNGSQVKKSRISPAEAIVLRSQFGVRVEGQAKPLSPFDHLHINDSTERSADSDFQRLTNQYGKVMMDKVFPGENPNIPMTFETAGFEETNDLEPKAGKAFHKYEDLNKLPKEEVTDEQSVKEVAEREAQSKLLVEQQKAINQMGEQVSKLLKANEELMSELRSQRESQQSQKSAPTPVIETPPATPATPKK